MNASKYGKKYELEIYNIVKKCMINNKLFNTQTINELGGCKSHNDIICNYHNEKNIG